MKNNIILFTLGMLTTLVIILIWIHWTQYAYIDDYTATQLKYGNYSNEYLYIKTILIVIWVILSAKLLSTPKNKDE